jgi:cell division protein FtsA
MFDNGIIAALDIGATKICCVAATLDENEGVNIVGIGAAPSHGMSRGRVTNVERTVSSIRKAVSEAEHMAGIEIKSVMLGVSGGNVFCDNVRGVVGVRDSRGKIISAEDKRRAIESAVSGDIPPDREAVHTLEQEYTVDGQGGIKDPLGMMGIRLEVDMHITMVSLSALQNILNSASQAGLKVEDDDVVLGSLASAEATLTPEEKGMGVAILDIGGGTTDIGVFTNGCVRHTAIINQGGDFLTKDIFKALRIPMDKAERLKINEGCCYAELLDPNENDLIVIPEDRIEVGRSLICDILESRMAEILGLAYKEIVLSEYDQNVMEVVITGGSSLLRGVPELAQEIFDRPVRVGFPVRMGGLSQLVSSPKYSTVLGLILFGIRHGRHAVHAAGTRKSGKGFWGNIFDKLLKRA